jgi:hypothetical protein
MDRGASIPRLQSVHRASKAARPEDRHRRRPRDCPAIRSTLRIFRLLVAARRGIFSAIPRHCAKRSRLSGGQKAWMKTFGPSILASGMPLAPSLALSWWLGFRIGFDGWSESCRLRGRNLHRARRDKIPGDLSGQELASLGSMPIPGFVNLSVELAMKFSTFPELATFVEGRSAAARLHHVSDRDSN